MRRGARRVCRSRSSTSRRPILAVPDAAKLQARRGFSPGKRQLPEGDPTGGSYVEDPGPPEADAPPVTQRPLPTTTSSTVPESTTTTRGGLLN